MFKSDNESGDDDNLMPVIAHEEEMGARGMTNHNSRCMIMNVWVGLGISSAESELRLNMADQNWLLNLPSQLI